MWYHLANSLPGCLRLIGYVCSLLNRSCQVSRIFPNPLPKTQRQGTRAIERQHQSVQWLSQLWLDVAIAFLETGGYRDVCHYLDGCSKAAKGLSWDIFGGPIFPL